MFQIFNTETSTHIFVGPTGGLCLELRAIPYLERTRASSREEICNLLPGKVFLLLQINKELVVFGRELELRTAGFWSCCWHSGLPNHAGRAMNSWGRGWTAFHIVATDSFRRILIWEPMTVVLLRPGLRMRGRGTGSVRVKRVTLGLAVVTLGKVDGQIAGSLRLFEWQV